MFHLLWHGYQQIYISMMTYKQKDKARSTDKCSHQQMQTWEMYQHLKMKSDAKVFDVAFDPLQQLHSALY